MRVFEEKGCRIRFVNSNDPFTKLKDGDMGTILHIDREGIIHVKWDSGSALSLLPDEDDYIVFPMGWEVDGE